MPLPVPTAALAYLHPDQRDRFAFELGDRSTREGREVVAVRFTETTRPTLIRDGGGRDLPARGTLLVGVADGALLEADVEYRFASEHGETMRVTTGFVPDPDLGLLVPDEIRQVVDPGAAADRARSVGIGLRAEVVAYGGRVETVLRYSGFERLSGGQ